MFKVPRANPIRIRYINKQGYSPIAINYVNRLPQFDLMELRTQYQKGVYANEEAYPDWLYQNQLSIQLQTDDTPTFTLYDIDGNVASATTTTNITPAGWSGLDVYKFTCYFPTTDYFNDGYYYILINLVGTQNYTLISDIFRLRTELPTDKDLVEIQFYSSENKNGFVFDGYYRAYYTGIIDPGSMEKSKSVIKEDNVNVLNSRSYSTLDVVLTEIHKSYYDTIGVQLDNEKIKINGIPYVSEKDIEQKKSEKTDLIDISFNLTADYDNDFMINS